MNCKILWVFFWLVLSGAFSVAYAYTARFGSSQTAQFGACKTEAMRVFRNGPTRELTGEYVQACMQSHGWGSGGCPDMLSDISKHDALKSQLPNLQNNAACYKRKDVLSVREFIRQFFPAREE